MSRLLLFWGKEVIDSSMRKLIIFSTLLMPALCQLPQISVDGVVNAASYMGGRIAPGEIVAIFGKNLGPADLLSMRLDESGKVATTLGGTRVFFNDFPAPLLAVRADQVNAVVPYGVPVGDMVRVQVSVRDVL